MKQAEAGMKQAEAGMKQAGSQYFQGISGLPLLRECPESLFLRELIGRLLFLIVGRKFYWEHPSLE